MKLFSHGCESRQAAYLVGADRLGAEERIALEAHAASCAECADALRNGRPVDAAPRSWSEERRGDEPMASRPALRRPPRRSVGDGGRNALRGRNLPGSVDAAV